MHCQFVCRSEHSYRDFLSVPQDASDRISATGIRQPFVTKNSVKPTPRLATRILVKGPWCPAAFLRIVWIECTGVPGADGVPGAKWDASLGGKRLGGSADMVVER